MVMPRSRVKPNTGEKPKSGAKNTRARASAAPHSAPKSTPYKGDSSKTGRGKKPRLTSPSSQSANPTVGTAFSPDSKPAQRQAVREELPPRDRRQGVRVPDRIGMILETPADADYALLDTGNGEKLERYGPLIIRRPEGQAVWLPSLSAKDWDAADAVFTGDTDEEGQGRWRYPKSDLAETWPLAFDGMPYLGRFTSFRHTGVFPEQAAHWRAMRAAIETASVAGRKVRVLNLFGYTGLASLVAARAGAEVTHVDASKKAIGWARENQTLAGLDDKPIRWICEDAMRFCAREVRRERTYDIILLDPPAFGRGAKGEVWHLFEHLPHLLDLVRALQSKHPLQTVLTSYAIRASHIALHELMQEAFAGMDGRLESGELVLRQEAGGRLLSTSMFCRYLGPQA
ncbi:MAG: class I SAM-dependent methyltransferase [Pseudomonadota bacterium]